LIPKQIFPAFDAGAKRTKQGPTLARSKKIVRTLAKRQYYVYWRRKHQGEQTNPERSRAAIPSIAGRERKTHRFAETRNGVGPLQSIMAIYDRSQR
jgi:hypothetical protein